MLVGTYNRNPRGRQACPAVLADTGYVFPDTPIAAFHVGRLDLLAEHLDRDPGLISRRFSLAEVFPPELGFEDPGEGLHLAPVAGATLLHLAIEYDDLEAAEWLVVRGADVDAAAGIDGEGFGGHTPLFHAAVTLGTRDDFKARFLLDRGANPNVRCSIRKQLRHMGGNAELEKVVEYRDVTTISFARRFIVLEWASEPAIAAIVSRGGTG